MVCVIVDHYEFIVRMRRTQLELKFSDFAKHLKMVKYKKFKWTRVIPTTMFCSLCEMNAAYDYIDYVTYGGYTQMFGHKKGTNSINLIFAFEGDCDMTLCANVLLNVFKESI